MWRISYAYIEGHEQKIPYIPLNMKMKNEEKQRLVENPLTILGFPGFPDKSAEINDIEENPWDIKVAQWLRWHSG